MNGSQINKTVMGFFFVISSNNGFLFLLPPHCCVSLLQEVEVSVSFTAFHAMLCVWCFSVRQCLEICRCLWLTSGKTKTWEMQDVTVSKCHDNKFTVCNMYCDVFLKRLGKKCSGGLLTTTELWTCDTICATKCSRVYQLEHIIFSPLPFLFLMCWHGETVPNFCSA